MNETKIHDLSLNFSRLEFESVTKKNLGLKELEISVIHSLALKMDDLYNRGYRDDFIFKDLNLSFVSLLCLFELEEIKRIKAEELLLKDSLTGLFNRKARDEHFERLCHRKLDNSVVYSVIDLDHFKKINDAYGHNTGDEVLVILGSVFKQCLRPFDMAFRVGGDEFVVVFTATEKEAVEIIDRVRDKFRTLAKEEIFLEPTVDFSFGFTLFGGRSTTGDETPFAKILEQVHSEADKNMYKHKNEKKLSANA